ncbi:hypothetical protein EU538_03265 [Candidatus Thorarchaeota archaeon]|nr:MAG: hypothetical protein EU538_03265 [Candidatus Thorarchaeota archaeon]
MIVEVGILVAIYSVWIVTLVNAMVSSEEISLTIATLPYIISFPVALIVSAIVEPVLPGIFMIDMMLTLVVGVLFFIRWIMAIVAE